MPLTRRSFLGNSLAGLSSPLWLPTRSAAGTAAFQPTWESLAHYAVPEWFRDAKFGIWAHWSAQCVPEQGDWYARLMYQQGEPAYEYHLGHYGWNSVNIGPKQDIVGIWAKTAREAGLRFGVSNHSAHAWHWFQTAYGYDGEGPMAGVRYDAAVLRREDGKGKWWEGLDPQDLYTGPNFQLPDGLHNIAAIKLWHEQHDGVWTEDPPPNNARFVQHWSLRCQDLLEKYHPDLVYFDDEGLPLGQAGLDVTAWFYNQSLARNHDAPDVVVTGKKLKPHQRGAVVEDVERGFSDSLRAMPWQTDTCLGNWHYDRSLFERHGYKSAGSVITRLCDVVAKNGNLLLSVPLRGDGTIDSDEVAILEALAGWMKINGEAIFGTRPWKIYGEGPTEVHAGAFGEGDLESFTAEDIRFTTRGGTLYALVMAWPDANTLTIKSLAAGAQGQVRRVELLGTGQALHHLRNERGLTITLPQHKPGDHACALRISGDGLV